MTRIVLAEKQRMVRQRLVALIEAEGDLVVVAESADPKQAVPLVEKHAPDVLVVDSGMAREVARIHPGTRVVLLLGKIHDLASLRKVASGFISRRSYAGEFIKAIRKVVAGRPYFSPDLTRRREDAPKGRSQDVPDSYDRLSKREREVLDLTAQGMSSRSIAGRLFISPRTVEIHRANTMRKLDLHNRTQLIRYVVERGLRD